MEVTDNVFTCVGLHSGIFVRGVGGGTMSYKGGMGHALQKS